MYRAVTFRAWACCLVCVVATTVPRGTFAQFVEPDVSVLYTLTSDQANDGFGFVADAIGDLNGDGASEIIIGALRNFSGGPLAGKAFVYSGRDGTLLNTVTGSSFNRLGHSVAGIGDADGDAIPDYAVGGPGTGPQVPQTQLGRLIVISGATHTPLLDVSGPAHLSFFGYDIGAAGDVNQDGHADVIVGAPFHGVGRSLGSVHFVSGKDGTTIRFNVTGAINGFGSAVSKVRDQDHDGIDDHAIGAFFGGDPPTGEGFVLSGDDGSIVRRLEAKKTGDQFGNFFVHDAGDVDADGFGDIFVGDFGDRGLAPSSGLGYVFFGARDDRRLFRPEIAGERLGPGRGAGDVNGDGHDDIVMAGFVNSTGALVGGKIYVFSGRNGKVLRTMTGSMETEQLGTDVLPVGDVNADGLVDFLVTGRRTAHLVLGIPLPH